MIKLENLRKVYRTKTIETTALKDINLEIKSGEFVSIMGPSGCGKSTLLNIMGLLDEPSQGKVYINDVSMEGDFSSKSIAAFRNQTLGFIFQSFHLIAELNVYDNVELPLLYRKMPAKERKTKIQEMLHAVGLGSRMSHFPSQLSGGQKQRVAIARALVGQPKIILADEPTGNLDSKMGNEVLDILLSLNKSQGTTIVMVTHDEAMARKTDRLIRLFDGTQLLDENPRIVNLQNQIG